MFPKPKSVLLPNTYAFESEPMVKHTGFREYDARWLFQKEINLMGVQALGMGLGALIAAGSFDIALSEPCGRSIFPVTKLPQLSAISLHSRLPLRPGIR